MARSRLRAVARVDDGALRGPPAGPVPTRKRATVLDRLLGGRQADAQQACRPHSAASRSSESARCEPRLFGAEAWISSTITVRVVVSISRPDSEPSRT